MILTVTVNLAVDVTYHLDAVRWRETNQVDRVAQRAGGKGVNVARVLHAFGHEAVVTGLVGGATGAEARAELAEAGLADEAVPMAAPSRRTLMVVESDGGATGFSEVGGPVAPDEWERFLAAYSRLIEAADAVVVAGSVPSGLPEDAYAQLVTRAIEAELPVLLDATGAALAHGVRAWPTIVKVNAEELAGIEPGEDVVRAAAAVRATGPEAVVVSQGAEGMVAVTGDGCWRCAPPGALTGNPTGAGDAASAALIVGALQHTPWPERLAEAVALSAAAVHAPLAGSFHPDTYARLKAQVTSQAIPPTA